MASRWWGCGEISSDHLARPGEMVHLSNAELRPDHIPPTYHITGASRRKGSYERIL